MNTPFPRTEQKPQVFANILIVLTLVIVLHFSLNVGLIHSIQVAIPIAYIQANAVSNISSLVAIPAPIPPAAQIQAQSVASAPAPARSAQLIPVPAPAPSLP